MDIKWLSRKFVMSVTIVIIFLLLAHRHIITPDMLLWSIMATVLSYILAQSTQKKYAPDLIKLSVAVTVWQRIKALFSRDYMLAYASIWGLSALLYFGYIPQLYVQTWFIAVTSIAACYNIGNAVSKI